eukprot:5897078-Karenia_brevis.AAC.1
MPNNTAEKNFESMGNAGSIARMKKLNLSRRREQGEKKPTPYTRSGNLTSEPTAGTDDSRSEDKDNPASKENYFIAGVSNGSDTDALA